MNHVLITLERITRQGKFRTTVGFVMAKDARDALEKFFPVDPEILKYLELIKINVYFSVIQEPPNVPEITSREAFNKAIDDQKDIWDELYGR